MDLTAIRAGLRDRVSPTVPNAYEYVPNGLSSMPAVWVDLPELGMLTFQRRVWNITLDVVLGVADSYDRSAQKTLDGLIPTIWAALEGDDTLGGAVNGSVTVQSMTPIKPSDNSPFVGAVFSVEVQHTDA